MTKLRTVRSGTWTILALVGVTIIIGVGTSVGMASSWASLSASQRDPIAADIVKLGLDQMVYLPLEWSDDVSAVAKNVRGMTGVPVVQRVNVWNIDQWEIS